MADPIDYYVKELQEERSRLLRVARAARALYPNIYLQPEWESTRQELYEAIREVNGLLQSGGAT